MPRAVSTPASMSPCVWYPGSTTMGSGPVSSTVLGQAIIPGTAPSSLRYAANVAADDPARVSTTSPANRPSTILWAGMSTSHVKGPPATGYSAGSSAGRVRSAGSA